jgi:FixJ family two-component response regulator
VVDDDASVRNALGRMLRASGYTVQLYASGQEFLDQCSTATAGCVLVDLDMPGLSGLELQMALARSNHPLPVVFLTGRGDIPSSVRAMRQGAEDFLTKQAPKADVLAAVERALARDTRERANRDRLAGLTPREREVLGHVVAGKLNKQIAAALGLNERTVKLHRTAITTKLGVPSVAELTKLWIEAGGV